MRLRSSLPSTDGEVIFVRYADGRLEIEGRAVGTVSADPLQFHDLEGQLRWSLNEEGYFVAPSGPLDFRIVDRGLVGAGGETREMRFEPSGELSCHQDGARAGCSNLTSRMEGMWPGAERLAIFTFAVARMVHEGEPRR